MTIVFLKLGSAQGIKIGDYFRVFRYQGTPHDSAYQEPGMAYKVEGMGHTPVPYNWESLPRQIIGEGIIMRTGTGRGNHAADRGHTRDLRRRLRGD